MSAGEVAVGDDVDVIADVRVGGAGRDLLVHPDVERDGVYDLWIHGGRLVDIAPAGAIRRSGRVLDAGGAWVVPGLWDHHVHTVQWALAQDRFSLDDARTAAEAARLAARAPLRRDGRRVGIRFRDGLWPDEPSRRLLDAATGDVPTYLINADLHSMWLNSAAMRREQQALDDSGMLREAPAFRLADRLAELPPEDVDDALDRAFAWAASRGVVGIEDFEVGWNLDRWRRRVAGGHDGVRIRFTVYPQDLDRAVADGFVTDGSLDGSALVSFGLLKVIADGSLGTRTAATTAPYAGTQDRGVLSVSGDEMRDLVARAASQGIGTTIHAIGDVACRLALDAFAATGVPGRIEHAQLVSRTDLPRFARLGVSASIQPEHALDDRELVSTEWADQEADAYPMAELRDAGADLLLGSDAPVSSADPWRQIAAAVFREGDGDEPWRPHQRIDVATALAAATAGGSLQGARVLPGERADLVVIADDPHRVSSARLRAMPVHATLVGGRLIHRA